MADCEDIICSPECLVVSMEPVTDPYSSDEDRQKRKRRRLHVKPKKKMKRLSKDQDTSLLRLIESCHISFLNIETSPMLKQSDKWNMNDVLSSLLSFVCKTPITAADAIKEVLTVENENPFLMKLLLQYNTYEIPEEYDGSIENFVPCSFYDFYKSSQKKLLCLAKRVAQFNEIADDAKRNQDELTTLDKSQQRTIVKCFFTEFCKCITEELKYKGEAILDLSLLRTERSNLRPKKREDYHVQSTPDLMLEESDSFHIPPVPIEVFSPLEWNMKTQNSLQESISEESDSENNIEPESPRAKKPTLSDESDYEFVKFLQESLPHEFEDDLPKESSSMFVQKCLHKVLVDILGCTKQYFVKYLPNPMKPDDTRTYTAVGMFAFHFNLYIVKIEGYYIDFFKFFVLNLAWHKRTGKCFKVSIYPFSLNCKEPTIGIAVMFFIKYYREVLKQVPTRKP